MKEVAYKGLVRRRGILMKACTSKKICSASGFAFGFQHFHRDLANTNEWKIMFDPSNVKLGELKLETEKEQ